MNFVNEEYELLVAELIGDMEYNNISNRGKIANIRQYCEIIIRKILDLPSDKQVTVGDKKILSALKKNSHNNNILMDSLEEIRKIGNKCTHTQYTGQINENDLNDVVKNLFNIYSYLFISYFEKYRFGNNNDVIYMFSILPPIIRYNTLKYLYEKDNKNETLIIKYCLAILKTFDKSKALDWINCNKKHLEKINLNDYVKMRDKEKYIMDSVITVSGDANLYDNCITKVNDVSIILEENGKLYTSFEEAKICYVEEKKHISYTKEMTEFISIMDFVYLGRNSEKEIKDENYIDYLVVKY